MNWPTKPFGRDAAGSGTFPSSFQRTKPSGQDQRVGQVLAVWLAAALAFGRQRFEHLAHSGVECGMPDSTPESGRSRPLVAQSFREEHRGDP